MSSQWLTKPRRCGAPPGPEPVARVAPTLDETDAIASTIIGWALGPQQARFVGRFKHRGRDVYRWETVAGPLELTPSGVLAVKALCSHGRATAHGSIRRAAAECGLSESQVRRLNAKLPFQAVAGGGCQWCLRWGKGHCEPATRWPAQRAPSPVETNHTNFKTYTETGTSHD